MVSLKPITRRQILDSSKSKEFADNNFKFDKNGRQLSKHVENTVGKGEIARYMQFLLFPECFQKACFPWASKGVIVREWVNAFNLDQYKILPFSKDLKFTITEYQNVGSHQSASWEGTNFFYHEMA